MSFLYLLTGCLDLALIAGQKKQRLPHAGITCLETKPEIALILDSKYISLNFFCFLSPLNRTETQDFGNKKGKKDSTQLGTLKFKGQPVLKNYKFYKRDS
jgi:hypothetical protein